MTPFGNIPLPCTPLHNCADLRTSSRIPLRCTAPCIFPNPACCGARHPMRPPKVKGRHYPKTASKFFERVGQSALLLIRRSNGESRPPAILTGIRHVTANNRRTPPPPVGACQSDEPPPRRFALGRHAKGREANKWKYCRSIIPPFG